MNLRGRHTPALFAGASMALFLTACSQLGIAPQQRESQQGLTLQIVHINDTHSQFDASPARLLAQDQRTFYTFIGGHPRLLTKARQLKANAAEAGVPSLFLHGGDAFKGSAYFELFEHKINIDILNRMQLDAMALGNHEFDIGLSKLAEFADAINFPLLAANVDRQQEPVLAGVQNLKAYQLYQLQGLQWQRIPSVAAAGGAPVLAVFGLALEDMRSMVPDTGALVFEAEVTAAQRTVDALQQSGVQHIVALTHLGNQRDLQLAARVNGIDVIVGGHSHSLLGDFRNWQLGQQGPYAATISNPDGSGITCVVQAGQFAQAIGQLTVQFDQAGQVSSCHGQNTILASRDFFPNAIRNPDEKLSGAAQQGLLQYVATLQNTALVEEDTALRQVLNDVYLPAVVKAYGEQISTLEQTINHVRLPGTGGSDQHGSILAGHIADAMLWWLNTAEVQQQLGAPVDLALIGAGNIRSNLEAGAVFEGHIRLEVLPFDAPLSVLTVTGQTIVELLQQTIAATLAPGAHAGKFPYSSQLRYLAQETPGYGLSLQQVEILQQGQWQPLQADKRYRLATTNYLANGNDGWLALQQAQQQLTDRQDVILLEGQPTAFAVERVQVSTDSRGQQAFLPVYRNSSGLPCAESGIDCKAAAQAFIDYLRAHPELWQQPRPATVTLQRLP
jgi:5'-nucleotidase